MNERRNMQLSDWVIFALNAAIGGFLGLATDGLVQLVTTAFWPVAVFITLLLAGVSIFDNILDRIFSIGVRTAKKPLRNTRTPLPLLLSLPAGAVLGVVVSRLGMADTLIGVIS